MRHTRPLSRYTTRMLGGAHRPRPPDYIKLVCRALAEVIKIDKRLRPFMEEQKRKLEQSRWQQECEAAVRKVYGPVPEATASPGPPPAAPGPGFPPGPLDERAIRQLLKDELALAKTRLLLAELKSKIR